MKDGYTNRRLWNCIMAVGLVMLVLGYAASMRFLRAACQVELTRTVPNQADTSQWFQITPWEADTIKSNQK